MKKIFVGISVVVITSMSCTSSFAQSVLMTQQTPVEQQLMQAFSEGFQNGFNNPESTLEDLLDNMTPREKFHVSRIVAQMDAIIQKAPTDEAKLQKSLDVSAYLMDVLASRFQDVVVLAMQAEHDPLKEVQLKKAMTRTPFLPSIKVILGSIVTISEKYTGRYVESYFSFIDQLEDIDEEDVTQQQMDMVIHKITSFYSMIESAFVNNTPTITKLMQDNVGMSPAQLFYSLRVAALVGLDEAYTDEVKGLDSSDEFDAEEIKTMGHMYSLIKNSFASSDELMKKAFAEASTLRSSGTTTLQYREIQKKSLKPSFVEMIDNMIAGMTDRMSNVQMRARDAKRTADLMQLSSALAVYYVDHNTYPATLDKLLGDYITMIPTDIDPNTQESKSYTYSPYNNNTSFLLVATMETSERANILSSDIDRIAFQKASVSQKKNIAEKITKKLCNTVDKKAHLELDESMSNNCAAIGNAVAGDEYLYVVSNYY